MKVFEKLYNVNLYDLLLFINIEARYSDDGFCIRKCLSKYLGASDSKATEDCECFCDRCLQDLFQKDI